MTSSKETYSKDYYVDSTISNYQNYLGRKYTKLAKNLIEYLFLQPEDSILDYGCGTGCLLFEFKKKGFENIKGTDISFFAIESGRKIYKFDNEIEHYNRTLLEKSYKHILCLDVLEHLPEYEIDFILKSASKGLKGCFILRVPVSIEEGRNYVLECSKLDKTHIQCHTRHWWVRKFQQFGYRFVEDLQLSQIYSSAGVLSACFKVDQ